MVEPRIHLIRIIISDKIVELSYGDLMSAKEDFRQITEFQSNFSNSSPVLILTDDKTVTFSAPKNAQFFAVLVPGKIND